MGGLLSYFKGLFGSREMRILILGLDGAGKTTLLYRLQVKWRKVRTKGLHPGSTMVLPFQVGEVVTTIPTIGFNVEQVTYKNLKFQVWDLGGQTSIRWDETEITVRFIHTIQQLQFPDLIGDAITPTLMR